MGTLRHLSLAASAALAITAAIPAAHANVLNPGDKLKTPDELTPSLGDTFLAGTGLQSFSFTTAHSGTISGEYEEDVYSDPTRSGELTFFIYVANTSTAEDSFGRVTTSDFTGFWTDVGYDTIGFPSGTLPDTVDRDLGGDDIGFNFTSTGIAPGSNAEWMEIDTNARAFTDGTIAVIDSHTFNLDGYSPTVPVPVPEPSTWAMLALGFASLGYAGFRTRKTSVSIV